MTDCHGSDTQIAHIATSGPLTMTSQEIAKLTGKDVSNIHRDIRHMLNQLEMTSDEFSANLPDTYGRLQPVFALPKDLTLTLISGYSVPMRHAIVTRWQELEGAKEVTWNRSISV